MYLRMILTIIGVFALMSLIGQGCGSGFESQTELHLPSSASDQRPQPPVIMAQPESITVNQGSTARFSLSVTGSAPMTYKWFKDGAELLGESSSILSITGVIESHAGSYTVVISNSAGSVASRIASLNVNLPPRITIAPQSQIVTVGTNVAFSVVAAGTAPLTYQWKRNGTDLVGATSPSLQISNAQVANSGNYSVVVGNMVSSVESASATLTVNPPVNNQISPTVTTQPMSQTVNAGADATFSVVATGTAPLTYQWKRNGTDIVGATSSTLALTNIQADRQGLYTVRVANVAGNVTSQAATLTVRAPVVIAQHPISQTVNAGASLDLTVVATGTGPINYQWKKGGADLPGKTSSTLSLSNVSSTDAGIYTVTVSNAVNSVTSQGATISVVTAAPSFAEVLPILQSKCMICHKSGGQASFANFSFTREEDFFATPWFRAGDPLSPAIVRTIGSGSATASMPAGGTAWTKAEFDKLYSWIVNARAPTEPTPDFNPAFACPPGTEIMPSTIQRLSKLHFTNSLLDFVSRLPSSSQNALISGIQTYLDQWPTDVDASGFSSWDNRITQEQVDMIVEIAMRVATQIVANNNDINSMIRDSTCGSTATKASLATANCLQSFISYYGRKALRRPLTTTEVTSFTNFYNGFSGDDKIVALLARFIAHPRFFYRLDLGEDGGSIVSGTAGQDATYQLGKYELLSKMTFTFWGAPPDDSLYNMVAGLDMNLDANINSVLDTILAHPNAKQGLTYFYSDWFQFSRLPHFDNPSPAFQTLVNGYNFNVAGHDHRSEMIREINDLLNHYTFNTNGRYEDLMSSPYSFARGQDLAQIYEVPVWNGSASNLVRFPASHPRSGLLTRAAFLASATEYTRPILKGKLLRTRLLCDDLPPPPPELNIKPLVQDPAFSTVEIVRKTTEDAKCMACHSQMNPLGFATENFDSIGRYRTTELKFNISGAEVNRVSFTTQTQSNLFSNDGATVDNGVDLANRIAASGKGQQCMVKQFFRHTHGRSENVAVDGCGLENMRLKLTSTGGSLLQMYKETAKQTPFRRRKIQ